MHPAHVHRIPRGWLHRRLHRGHAALCGPDRFIRPGQFSDSSDAGVPGAGADARVLRGVRVYGAGPRSRGQNLTLLDGAADGPAFVAYVRAFLVPTLRPS